MDKQRFLNMFKGEDEFLISSLWDDVSLSLDIQAPIYTTVFLSPQISTKLIENSNLLGVNLFSLGLSSFSEKRVFAFAPKDTLESELDFPIVFFKIVGTSKFKNLEHKDFLGAIMSLGLKRELLGDILVKDNTAYCISFDSVFKIIETNLKKINIVPVDISILEDLDEIPENKFKDISTTVTSLRLDSVVSAMLNISRNTSSSLIENGDVLVSYSTEKNKTKTVVEGSVITIKQYGKYILFKTLGENKKGKIKILIKQYV